MMLLRVVYTTVLEYVAITSQRSQTVRLVCTLQVFHLTSV